MTEKETAPADGGGGKPGNGGGTPPGNGGTPPGNGGGKPPGGDQPGDPGGGGGPDPHQHTWGEAQDLMLKTMTQDEKNAYFTSSSEQQNQAVQDWHQQNFGTNTSTEMPFNPNVVEGKYMPGGKG
jgi:hypothetical protein